MCKRCDDLSLDLIGARAVADALRAELSNVVQRRIDNINRLPDVLRGERNSRIVELESVVDELHGDLDKLRRENERLARLVACLPKDEEPLEPWAVVDWEEPGWKCSKRS
jgi:hypothetical protein